MEFYQEDVGRTPSSTSILPPPPPLFYSPPPIDNLNYIRDYQFPPPSPFSPHVALGPLSVRKMRYSPSVPNLHSHIDKNYIPAKLIKDRNPILYYKHNSSDGTYPTIEPPKPPKRSSSTGSSLKRAHTVAGGGRNTRKPAVSPLAPPALKMEKKLNIKMGWIQRPSNKRHTSISSESEIPLLDGTDGVKSKLLKKLQVPDNKTNWRSRALTAPPTPDLIGTPTPTTETKRAVSSGSYGFMVKKRIESFSKKTNRSTPIQEGEMDKIGLLSPKEISKGWKKRVFSFRGNKEAQIHEEKGTPSICSAKTVGSERTGVVHSNMSKSSMDSGTTQTTLTVGDNKLHVQLLGGSATIGTRSKGTEPFEEIIEDGPEKLFNDSVVGMFEGKLGLMGLMGKKERYAQKWKPPILNITLQSFAGTERVPVTISQGQDIWVAIVLHAKIGGDIDLALQNIKKAGLDVGVLLDVSSYTSPEGLQEMRTHARQLVDGMDTSNDRIAVMTFSAPPIGRRNPSFKGRSNLKLLNSSGSVAKRQLMEEIANLDGGLQIDPTLRDVSAAVAAAIKILHQMPLDTSRYGSRRAGHLFLFTSKLDEGELTGDFRGITVHVMGIGAAFSPTNSMGGNGWCASLASPLGIQGYGIQTTSPSTMDLDEINMGCIDVNQVLNVLRTNIDVGTIEDARITIKSGEDCEIKAILGNTTLGTLFPGECRSLMVKVRVSGIKDWTGTESISGNDTINFSELERQLEATLGELKSTILTVETTFRHSNLGEFGPKCINTNEVHINRYVEDCAWGLPKSNASTSDSDPGDTVNARKEFVRKFLIQNIAACQESAVIARKIIQNFEPMSGTTLLMKELEYKEWLEVSMNRPRNVSGSAKIADSHGNLYSLPMMEVFESMFSKKSTNNDHAENNPTPRLGSSNTAIHNPLRALPRIEPLCAHRRTPDEARRLWIQLGGFKEELDTETTQLPGGSSLEEKSFKRASSGEATLITLRDVRETDFSPWVL